MEKKTATLIEHQQALYELLIELDRVCKKLHIKYSLFAGTMLGAVRHNGFIPWDDDADILMSRKEYEKFMKEADGILDSEKFYLQREFSEHFPMFFSKLRLNGTACLEKYHPKDVKSHQGVYIDIFPCDDAANTNVGRKIQFLCSKVVIAKSLYARGYETDSALKKLFMYGCRLLPLAPFLRCVKKESPTSDYVHTFLGSASAYEKNIYPRKWFDNSVELTFEKHKFMVADHYKDILKKIYGDYMKLPPEDERKPIEHAILVDLHHSYEEYENFRDDMEFDVYTKSIR